MKQIVFGIALLGAFGTLSACGGSDEDPLPSAVGCEGSIPKYAELKTTSLAKCLMCHSSTHVGDARYSAPSEVNFDTHQLAKASATAGASAVNEGAMPPMGVGVLTDAEKQALYKWAQCGTPQ